MTEIYNRKIAVIGGDFRTVITANELSAHGFAIDVYGFSKVDFNDNVNIAPSLNSALHNADYILLPLPCSRDGVSVNACLFESKILLEDILINNAVILAGKIDESFKSILKHSGNKYIDYLECEDLSVANAVPTAEGAIEIAMHELPVTVCGCNALVMGFGRISKILSKMLYGIGANVSVCARKQKDLAMIEALGYEKENINSLCCLDKYDVIFNTVPSVILDEKNLKKVNRSCLIIDLASKPGGVDFEAAKKLSLNVIWALSLPGRVAPVSAGKIIKNTVINIINEMEGE